MQLRRRHIWGMVLAILGTMFYFYGLHRVERVEAAEGWRLRFSYQPFHCRVCLGAVEELSLNGVNVDVPQWKWNSEDGNTPVAHIVSPVGNYRAFQNSKWQPGHVAMDIRDVPDSASDEDLYRGWYDAGMREENNYHPSYGPYRRLRGTPKDWCLMVTTNAARWGTPTKLAGLDW